MMMDNFMVGYYKERLDDVTQEELFSLDFVKRMQLHQSGRVFLSDVKEGSHKKQRVGGSTP